MFEFIKNIFKKTKITDTEVDAQSEWGVTITQDEVPLVLETTVDENVETTDTLTKMNKKSIDELAKTRFGVELDRRERKDKMVKAFLKAQSKKES
jgi:hypothetical protein